MKIVKCVLIIILPILMLILVLSTAHQIYITNTVSNYEKKDMYIADLENGTVTEFMTASGFEWCTYWSGDSKYFLIIYRKLNLKEDILEATGRLFRTADLKEIDLPKEVNNKEYLDKYALWLNNNEFMVSMSESLYSQPDKTLVYNINTNKISYKMPDTPKSKPEDERLYSYNIPAELSESLKKKIGCEYSDCILSSDRSKFYYSTLQNDVYLYDLKKDEKIKLFTGFSFQLSPDETKICYKMDKGGHTRDLQILDIIPGDGFKTYVLDLNTMKSIKIANFYAGGVYSPNEHFMTFVKNDYWGMYPE